MNGGVLTMVGIPSAQQCVWLAGPILSVLALRWLWLNLDEVVARLFPHWEFEQRLGWLNLRAQQRAAATFRWITHLVHALLAVALVGILWSAEGLGAMNPEEPETVALGVAYLPVLMVSLGFWIVYLGWELAPKMRREYEEQELERYRAENPDPEEEAERARPRVPTLQQDHRRLVRRRR